MSSHSADAHEAAARWRLVEAGGRLDLRQRRARDAWLAETPAHASAYAAAGQALDTLDAHADDPLLAEFRAEAAAALAEPAAAPLRRRMVFGGLGLAAAAAVAGVAFLPTLAIDTDSFATPPGAPQTVALRDGSRLILDGDTRVTARFSQRARQLDLAQGQARFDVAHDAARPLTVTVGRHRVEALGTSFSIDRLADRSVVTLLSGRVRVGLANQPGRWQAVLAPGETFVGADAGPGRVSRRPGEAALAWSAGRMVLDDTPLADAVMQLNRRGARLHLTDPALGRLRVTGVFRADDPTAFVEAVTGYLAIDRRPSGDGAILLSPRPGTRP